MAVFEGPLSEAEDSGTDDDNDDDEGLAPDAASGPCDAPECPTLPRYGRQLRELIEGPLSHVEGLDSCFGEAVAPAQGATFNIGDERSTQLQPPIEPGLGKQEKARLAAADRKRRRRLAQQQVEGSDEKRVAKKRRLEAAQDVIYVDYSLSSATGVTQPGWIGKPLANLPLRVFTLSELQEDYDMTHFPWDGRTTHLLLDSQGRVVGVLLGWPKDTEGWQQVQDGAFKVLDLTAAVLPDRLKKAHRRGTHPSLAHGLSFGGGQKKPRFIKHSRATTEVLEGLMGNGFIQRICKNASCGFRSYGEQTFRYMEATVEAVRGSRDDSPDEGPTLRRPYDDQVGGFPCRSFNLGKQTATVPHTDNCNLAQSWCSITPVGNFNHQEGGQLVLWDFGMVIDFPAGSTILIPSALVVHSNTPLKTKQETRYSVVQYVAGGLFRWVENGFMTEQDRQSNLPNQQRQDNSWAKAAAMFTTISEIEGSSHRFERRHAGAELPVEGLPSKN